MSPPVSERNLEDLTLPEVRERVRPTSTLLWPIGAVEQHGPHLPLSVDHVVAHESAQAAAAECGEELDVWVLPTLSISKSDEHSWSPGSLWLSAETLLAVVRDVASSAATTGAERLVFLNAHGGNTALLSVACREVRRLFGLRTFLVHPFVPPDHGGRSSSGANELGMGIHGGHDETSVMLHLRPELVQMDKAVRQVPEGLTDNQHVRFGGGVSFGWLSNDFGPDGHIGDPTKASAEAGKQLFEGAVALLTEQLAEISTFNFGR